MNTNLKQMVRFHTFDDVAPFFIRVHVFFSKFINFARCNWWEKASEVFEPVDRKSLLYTCMCLITSVSMPAYIPLLKLFTDICIIYASVIVIRLPFFLIAQDGMHYTKSLKFFCGILALIPQQSITKRDVRGRSCACVKLASSYILCSYLGAAT